MSLQIDESGRRGRSRSPGRREERDRSRGRAPEPEALDMDAIRMSSPPAGFRYDDDRSDARRSTYDYGDPRGSSHHVASPTIRDAPYRRSRDHVDEDDHGKSSGYNDRGHKADKDRDRDRDLDRMNRDHRDRDPERSYKADKDRDRESDKDRDRDLDRFNRDHRDRDRDSDRDRDRDLDRFNRDHRDRDRDSDKDRDRDLDRFNRDHRDREHGPERSYKADKDRDSDKERDRLSGALAGAASFLPAKYSQKLEAKSRDSDSDKEKKKKKKDKMEEDLAYGSAPLGAGSNKYSRPESPPNNYAYAKTQQWEYDKPDEKLAYNLRNGDSGHHKLDAPGHDKHSRRASSPGPSILSSSGKKYHTESHGGSARSSGANILTVEPGSSSRRERSPAAPSHRMSSLSVSTGLPVAGMGALSLANAPGSPLLESYHGTYQSMSPMPSPLLLASNGPGGFPDEPLSPGVSDDERGGKKKRRARFSDPVDDAARLAKALKGEKRAPETEPLIEILPGMTHEQIMELRVEYKRLVKTGSDRKGVNVAKHIRARLKDEDPLLMKACYSTALGKWEGEAYWANFWYQGDKTRRELLIESIMGRTNDEIRKIKDGFSDKKYRDSLSNCMKTELKEDKFKKAVLMVLEERRMEETDEYGRPLPIDKRLVQEDAENLYRAVRSEKGGESAMIQIVIMRSDSHLRDVLKHYERVFRSNFARDALKKSGNLVGELLAHILNGVINKPVRDALLLHHALSASKKDNLRRELLISRLVRFHWDRHHLAAVKKAYRDRYGADLSEAIKEGTTGEWGLFCRELAVTRMPDDVKRFSKVEIING